MAKLYISLDFASDNQRSYPEGGSVAVLTKTESRPLFNLYNSYYFERLLIKILPDSVDTIWDSK